MKELILIVEDLKNSPIKETIDSRMQEFEELGQEDSNEFFKELASCEAVITNGGYSLMSEAVSLGKPVLSIPVNKQFEQILNAVYLDKLGYGKFSKSTNREDIVEFLANLGKYRKNLKKFKRQDNSKIIKRINYILKAL